MTSARTWMIVGLAGLCLAAMGPAIAVAEDENEQQITMDQLPPAVKAAVQKEIGTTQPDEIEKETTKDGKTVYEVEWRTDKAHVEATFAEDGKLLRKTVQTRPEKITVDQMPEPARKSLLAEAGKAEIKTVLKTVRNDKAFFKAEWKLDGKEAEVVLDQDGKVLMKEQEIAVDALPDAVKAALKKELGDNKPLEAEKVTRGEKVVYEVEWKADGKEVEAVFSSDGKLLRKQTGDDDEDDQNDDDADGDD